MSHHPSPKGDGQTAKPSGWGKSGGNPPRYFRPKHLHPGLSGRPTPHEGEGGVTLQPWLTLWNLTPDGEAFTTQFGSILLPVRQGGVAAMLKVPSSHEERRGGRLIAWYGADGAARVLAVDDRAVLLERAAGARSLAVMARGGQDDAATAVLCETIARLHAERTAPPPAIPPLAEWFAALPPAAARFGGAGAGDISHRSRRTVGRSPRDVRVLHGDVHHENVLDFGPREAGWPSTPRA